MVTREPSVAIVHDWLTNLGGAERVVLAMLKAFPGAHLYTSVYNESALPQFKEFSPKTSFLQNWPLARRKHQLFPQLRQLAFESFDLSGYDVVLTSSTAEAKGIVTPTETKHISYIHTPTRYYWSHSQQYIDNPGFGILDPVARKYFTRSIEGLKQWDFAAAQRADVVLANSQTVADRIARYYKRQSTVIFPPVDVERFAQTLSNSMGDYYLVVSRLIPYKRIDLVVEAFNKNGHRLIVVGNGSEESRLRAMANPNIEFQTRLTDAHITKLMQQCRVFIFPTEEDFGITPVEAMAAGKPVIAYGRGGATETVIDGKTGIYFSSQNAESLNGAIARFEKTDFHSGSIVSHAQKFSEAVFITNIQDQVKAAVTQHGA